MVVHDIIVETPRVKSIRLKADGWAGHLPGQHVDIRLTAEDGYQAERSYSLASPPGDELLALTVERVEDGEVSPYLLDTLRAGDRLELRGPIGRYFVWTGAENNPLYLIAGGSGVTPLMSMLRHRDKAMNPGPACLIYSSRRLQDVIYRHEIDAMARRDPALRIVHALTREAPPRLDRPSGTGRQAPARRQLLRTRATAGYLCLRSDSFCRKHRGPACGAGIRASQYQDRTFRTLGR